MQILYKYKFVVIYGSIPVDFLSVYTRVVVPHQNMCFAYVV